MKDAAPELISGVAFVVVGKAVIERDESGAGTDIGKASERALWNGMKAAQGQMLDSRSEKRCGKR